MYGLIYSTLQSLVVDQICGGFDEQWKKICQKAGIDPPDKFLDHHYYDEAILHQVAIAAAEVLDIPLSTLLEKFGAKFFEVTNQSGHSSMLHTLGHNLYGFLSNLDSLHNHLSYTYTEMQAPSFQCEKTPGGLLLHYYSKRKGLQAIVVGIIKEVARDFYSLDIEMTLEEEETRESEHLCNHYVFSISVLDSTKDPNYMERLSGTTGLNRPSLTLRNSVEVMLDFNQPAACPVAKTANQVINLSPQPSLTLSDTDYAETEDKEHTRPKSMAISKDDEDMVKQQILEMLPLRLQVPLLPTLNSAQGGPKFPRRNSLFIPSTDEWPITPSLFQNCFPFHIIFDKDMVIQHMGISLKRLYPWAISSRSKITDYFIVERPAIPAFTYQHIRTRIHNEFILQTKTLPSPARGSGGTVTLQFRGQMVPTLSFQSYSPILFLSSPRVQSIKELESQGLYLSDIPLHDVTRDLILMNRHLRVEMNIARQLEETRQELEVEQARVQEEKARADELLHAMLPPSVTAELKSGAEASATEYSMVTILFSDIKGFTNICSRCQPMQVVTLLNELYTRFDKHIDHHGVYKVETIGDAYMIAAGLLDTSPDHATAVTEFAFSMREEASCVLDPTTFLPLQIRIGINSGPIVAGVVGMKMPRYCLFGNTVNLASRMESTGREGKVHISQTTYDCLQQQKKPFYFECRGLIQIKGLREMRKTYWVEPLLEGDVSITKVLGSQNASNLSQSQRNSSFIGFDIRRRRSTSASSTLQDDVHHKVSISSSRSSFANTFKVSTQDNNGSGPITFFAQNQVSPEDAEYENEEHQVSRRHRKHHKCVIS